MLTYDACTLCPRRCGVNRTAGQLGFCRMPARMKAARAALHYWEEPVISGENGSGAVFFSGCTLRCAFCQNSEISDGGFGAEITTQRLRQIFENLIQQGAENINLVTPTHFLPSILPALTPKLPVPVVYNCSGYERVETLQELDGLVDIYLPDLKYADGNLAAKLSAAPDYFEVATAAIREMVRQTGPCVVENGLLKRGTVIRHLVLPGQVGNSLDVLDWLGRTFAPGTVMVSLMSQYVPMGKAVTMPPFDRHLTEDEYAAVESWLPLCGLENGFTQDFAAATVQYIPAFDLEGIEK